MGIYGASSSLTSSTGDWVFSCNHCHSYRNSSTWSSYNAHCSLTLALLYHIEWSSKADTDNCAGKADN